MMYFGKAAGAAVGDAVMVGRMRSISKLPALEADGTRLRPGCGRGDRYLAFEPKELGFELLLRSSNRA